MFIIHRNRGPMNRQEARLTRTRNAVKAYAVIRASAQRLDWDKLGRMYPRSAEPRRVGENDFYYVVLKLPCVSEGNSRGAVARPRSDRVCSSKLRIRVGSRVNE